jgi:hypothetical protein
VFTSEIGASVEFLLSYIDGAHRLLPSISLVLIDLNVGILSFMMGSYIVCRILRVVNHLVFGLFSFDSRYV